ncbi:MAG TPA: hypothetical protein VHP33_30645, partial [Polyangiaceae bacterium]|nr:hypothetical protein [Polyangiaceae bacterium]
RSDAAEIWRAYMRRELSADFVPTGKVRPPPPQRPLPLPSQRFDPPRAPAGNQRRNQPSQPARGGGPSQQTRGNGPSQQTRGNGPSQQTRGDASRPAGRNFGKAHRVAPEVIVRPRAAERPAPSEPSGSEKRDPAAASRARRLP